MNTFVVSIGSDLEAFSLSQADDSFATLVSQPAALPIV